MRELAPKKFEVPPRRIRFSHCDTPGPLPCSAMQRSQVSFPSTYHTVGLFPTSVIADYGEYKEQFALDHMIECLGTQTSTGEALIVVGMDPTCIMLGICL